MSNNDIVAEIAKRDWVRKVLAHYPMREYHADLHQYVYLTLLTYRNEKLDDCWKNRHCIALINRIVKMSLYSPNSPFYRQYIRYVKGAAELSDSYEASDAED